jgi:hypothetical protein
MKRKASPKNPIARGRVYGLAALAVAICSLLFASSAGAIVAGAGFTTFDSTLKGCLDSKNGVDCNNYEGKEYVATCSRK